MVKLKYTNNPDKIQSELKRLNKNQVVNETLYEFKQEVLLDYSGEFEKIGRLAIGDQIKQTNINLELLLIMKL